MSADKESSVKQPDSPLEFTPQRPARFLNRNFVLLWQGQLVSQIGSQAFTVAMMYWTMQATGSASLMGVLMMLSMLPGVMLGPLGGTIADRYSKKAIIIISDMASGVGVTTVAVAFFLFPDAVELLIILLFIISIINGVVQAFFRPAILAAIPDIVPLSRVSSANSASQFSFQFSSILGQSSGGVLYALLGPPVLFLVDGLTFLFSAASESLIQIPKPLRKATGGLRQSIVALHHELMEGLFYVWRWHGMRNFLLLVSVIHFFAMPFIVLMPFYVTQSLGRGSEWYGFLMAGFSAGSVLGCVLAGTMHVKSQQKGYLLLLLLAGTGVLFGFLGYLTSPLAALINISVAGALLGFFNVNVMTIYQTSTRQELRGRVMGLLMTLTNVASPLGMLAGGVVGDFTNKNIPLIYGVCGAMILAVVAIAGTQRSILTFLAGGRKAACASGPEA